LGDGKMSGQTPNIFVPDKTDYMPEKKLFLARAGIRYTEAINDENIMKDVNEIYLLGLECAKPKLFWRTFQRVELPDYSIPSQFAKYNRFLIFTSTLGKEIDQKIEELSKFSVYLSFLLDSWASESLEKLNDTFEEKFKKENGKALSMRFSPGYGDLDIRTNKKYVELLNLDSEITVLDSGIMIPRKTTTCIAGIVE